MGSGLCEPSRVHEGILACGQSSPQSLTLQCKLPASGVERHFSLGCHGQDADVSVRRRFRACPVQRGSLLWSRTIDREARGSQAVRLPRHEGHQNHRSGLQHAEQGRRGCLQIDRRRLPEVRQRSDHAVEREMQLHQSPLSERWANWQAVFAVAEDGRFRRRSGHPQLSVAVLLGAERASGHGLHPGPGTFSCLWCLHKNSSDAELEGSWGRLDVVQVVCAGRQVPLPRGCWHYSQRMRPVLGSAPSALQCQGLGLLRSWSYVLLR